jgi:hypothetical protein
LLNRMRDFVGL